MNEPKTARFELNGRDYVLPPQPVVVICIDGCENDYLDAALGQGRMPRTAAMLEGGHRSCVRGALPSFTNVNNAAIVAGVPPSVTGIGGNFFLDPDTGAEVMMNSPDYLRCGTILAAASAAGRKVAMVTAKDKLRRLLSPGLDGICFSAEKAGETTLEEHGITGVEALVGRGTPDVYSGDLSLFALEAGAALLEQGRADFLYLTLSDYVQHKHAPDESEALDFYAGIDAVIGRCLDAGAIVGVTADHGMNDKTREGRPNVVYLETELRERFGDGIRVICTITDPYVVHHGALGGFVVVHADDATKVAAIEQACRDVEGVTEVYRREDAARELELPLDRLGDLVVMAARDTVLGRTAEDHDLSLLGGRLRSHGSRFEETVPLLTSEPLPDSWRAHFADDPRSFDLFAVLCAVA